jgi:hypothetical protein
LYAGPHAWHAAGVALSSPYTTLVDELLHTVSTLGLMDWYVNVKHGTPDERSAA